MKITLRYFAIAREAVGRTTEERDVPLDSTAGDVLASLADECPALARLQPILLLMVNQEYAERNLPLREGDEVALIPPVSGGGDAEPVPSRFRVQAEPIDPRLIEASVVDGTDGGIVTFAGNVRDLARGKQVTAIDYEAYRPAAVRMLARIGAEVEERWGLTHFAIVHRTGLLRVGETSVVIVAAAAHRAEAFAAAAYAIDRIKEIVPIWKHEHYADGSFWVGTEAEYQTQVKQDLSTSVPSSKLL